MKNREASQQSKARVNIVSTEEKSRGTQRGLVTNILTSVLFIPHGCCTCYWCRTQSHGHYPKGPVPQPCCQCSKGPCSVHKTLYSPSPCMCPDGWWLSHLSPTHRSASRTKWQLSNTPSYLLTINLCVSFCVDLLWKINTFKKIFST